MKLELLAHRGVWKSIPEQNTLQGFEEAFVRSWGIEFDVRDHKKNLIISHDAPTGDEFSFESVLSLYKKVGNDVTLAINIKSDGLVDSLKNILEAYQISNYFVFDMSIPETVRYSRAGMTIFIRRSEYENYEDNGLLTSGVWLDNFGAFSNLESVLKKYLENNISIALVSPELHKMEFHHAWSEWKKIFKQYNDYRGTVYLCTDFPQDALTYFWEKERD